MREFDFSGVIVIAFEEKLWNELKILLIMSEMINEVKEGEDFEGKVG